MGIVCQKKKWGTSGVRFVILPYHVCKRKNSGRQGLMTRMDNVLRRIGVGVAGHSFARRERKGPVGPGGD